MTLTIKSVSKDSEIYSFAKEIEINNHRLQTPFPVKNPTIAQETMPTSLPNEMYEFWSTFNIKEVLNAPIDNNLGDKVIKRYRNKNIGTIKNKPKIFLTSYKDIKGNPFKVFDKKLIEFMIDASYLYTDVVTFPIINGVRDIVNNPSILQDYLDFIDLCYEIAETLNNKPIMGIIPPIPPAYIPKIVDKFYSLGLMIFCFDFNGSSLSAYYPHYSQVFRTLYNIDRAKLEEIIKYVINLKLPSNRNRYNPFPAEDLLTPFVGTDILGINHLSGGSSTRKTPQKKGTRRTTKTTTKVNTNLLNTNEYTYHRISSKSDFEKVFSRPLIKPSFQNFTTATYSKRNTFQKKFNYANLTTEMNNLHKIIKNNESVLKFLTYKKGIKDQIDNKVKWLDNFIRMKSLYDF
ncbi:hypothetical protein LCGC14_0563820 [marine sediment metagenome]|uniref:Uncharacterized protein n=1 Tax=marine sediment metagenome TaxID=412755 RepID=A0A0F9U7S9_9ZZZZ|nr:MAG: hypothetical protein Lokiarch_40810 [Candidatus Lokiarchaeum sp. GC14_75]HEA71012.1 hypothetical protein [archaeon]